MSNRESLIQSDKVEAFATLVRTKLLPHFSIMSSRAMAPGSATKSNYASLTPSDCFRCYHDSNYHYKGQNKFIHFTNYESCRAILKSKKFRLNSLGIMDDKLEVSYLHDIFKSLNFNLYSASHLKRNLYALSLCNYDIEEKEESLSMWDRYGDKFLGVGLVLEMDLDYSHHWVFQMLSTVHYGKDCLADLESFSEAYKEFRSANDGFEISGIDKLLRNILAYHKAHIYKDEKEVRLLYSENAYETDVKLRKEIPIEFKQLRQPSDYYPFIPTQEEIDHIFPNIYVKKILIGSKVTTSEFNDRKKEIESLTKDYKVKPEIEFSTLKKYF